MNDNAVREMTPAECIAKARNNLKEAEIKIATAERLAILAEKRMEADQVKYQPVTGRPFAVGVNEPEEGQNVYLADATGHVGRIRWDADEDWLMFRLIRGELYPTEADCTYGEKKREIEARYRGMGREFEPFAENYNASWVYEVDVNDISINWSRTWKQEGTTWFDTKEDCQSAIDTIDREYGEGAFKEFVLGVIK